MPEWHKHQEPHGEGLKTTYRLVIGGEVPEEIRADLHSLVDVIDLNAGLSALEVSMVARSATRTRHD